MFESDEFVVLGESDTFILFDSDEGVRIGTFASMFSDSAVGGVGITGISNISGRPSSSGSGRNNNWS